MKAGEGLFNHLCSHLNSTSLHNAYMSHKAENPGKLNVPSKETLEEALASLIYKMSQTLDRNFCKSYFKLDAIISSDMSLIL